MKAEQVDTALRQKFISEDERLVFWHDPNGEFADYDRGGPNGRLADAARLWLREQGLASLSLRDDPKARTTFLDSPHEEYDKEAVRECLEYALEARRRIEE